jgi:hypothetical protein
VFGRTAREEAAINEWLHTTGHDRAEVKRLLPGRYHVRATGLEILPGAAIGFDVRPGDRTLEVVVTVREAAIVRLSLRTNGGQPVLADPHVLPSLVIDGQPYPCVDLAKGRRGTYSWRNVGYRSLPPGNATLSCADDVIDGELSFLPFDPPPPVSTRVEAGRNDIVLEVERRAVVDLRACERSGREQLGASITVFQGDRKVRSLDCDTERRFRSFLPPGEYRVAVDRNGLLREHALLVARQDIVLRLRP